MYRTTKDYIDQPTRATYLSVQAAKVQVVSGGRPPIVSGFGRDGCAHSSGKIKSLHSSPLWIPGYDRDASSDHDMHCATPLSNSNVAADAVLGVPRSRAPARKVSSSILVFLLCRCTHRPASCWSCAAGAARRRSSASRQATRGRGAPASPGRTRCAASIRSRVRVWQDVVLRSMHDALSQASVEPRARHRRARCAKPSEPLYVLRA